mmetsp:Transcript_2765/g.10591  ORF Transcript_2765/g.10591 Transcript_2765/m.10591 type:complete len:278 (+) Transcript_2765:314-1147(+)
MSSITKRTCVPYSSMTELSNGRSLAHGVHPSEEKKATRATLKLFPFSSSSRSGSFVPPAPNPTPWYSNRSASDPTCFIELASKSCDGAGDDKNVTGSTNLLTSPPSESNEITAARTLFALAAKAVPIGLEPPLPASASRLFSTGPCHCSAATPDSNPVPRATNTPGYSVVPFSLFSSLFTSTPNEAAHCSESIKVFVNKFLVALLTASDVMTRYGYSAKSTSITRSTRECAPFFAACARMARVTDSSISVSPASSSIVRPLTLVRSKSTGLIKFLAQ